MTNPPVAPVELQPPPRSPHPIQSLLTLLVRLLALGITAGIATLLGVAIAYVYPAPNPDQPLLATLLRYSETWLSRIRQPIASLPSASPALPATEATESLPDAGASPETVPLPPAIATATSADQLIVTLPTDALFATDQTTFRANAPAILDSIVIDLQQFAGATVRVASHTDPPQEAEGETFEERRSRALAQAQAVKTYLVSRLGDNYHWVVVGYGGTRPLVTPDNTLIHPRNRRIEITIDPQ